MNSGKHRSLLSMFLLSEKTQIKHFQYLKEQLRRQPASCVSKQLNNCGTSLNNYRTYLTKPALGYFYLSWTDQNCLLLVLVVASSE